MKAARITCWLFALALVPHAASADPNVLIASSIDGTWSKVTLKVEPLDGASAIYDPARDRMIVFGGAIDDIGTTTNRTLAWQRSAQPTWSVLDAIAPADPIPALTAPAILDAPADRMVLVRPANEAWVLPLGAGGKWTRLPIAGIPPATVWRAVFDPSRDRAIVLGSVASSSIVEVWALSLGATPGWSHLAATGTPPSPQQASGSVYDPTSDAVLTLGKNSAFVWKLPFASAPDAPVWATLSPAGAPPVWEFFSAATLDSAANQLTVLAQVLNPDQSAYLSETWALSLGGAPAWTPVASAASEPPNRLACISAFDPARREMLVYGGFSYNTAAVLQGIFVLGTASPADWRTLGIDAAGPQDFQVGYGVVDPLRERLLVGGDNGGSAVSNPVFSAGLNLAGLPAWSPAALSTKASTAAAYDPRRNEVITFGGIISTVGTPSNQTGFYAQGNQPALTLDAGPLPPASIGSTLLYDSRRDRMLLVFAGNFDTNAAWTLALTGSHVWSPLLPSAPLPAARRGCASTLDPLRDRVILFGGVSGSGGSTVNYNDTWALALAGTPQWSQLAPTGTPPPAGGTYYSIYDPVRDRIVVRGPGGVWALALTSPPVWSLLTPAGTAPPLGKTGKGGYDPVQDQYALQIPVDTGNGPSATWTLKWGEPAMPMVSCLTTPVVASPGSTADAQFAITNPLSGPRAIGWKVEGNRNWPGLAQFGTAIITGNDVVHVAIAVPDTATGGGDSLRFTAWFEGGFGNNATCDGAFVQVLPVPFGSGALSLALESPRPNPASALRVSFTLPNTRGGELDAFDISGRRVAHRSLAGLAAGRHEATLGDARLGPGVYMIRLRQGGRAVTQRAAIIR